MDGYRTLARLGLVVGLIGVEVYLARDLTSTSAVTGFTLTRSQTVAPPRPARIESIAVQLGDVVTAGQALAEIDATEVENELATAKAERDRAAAALRAESVKLQVETSDTVRRFASNADSATAQLVSAQAEAKTAAAELEAVEAELANQRDLVERHLADATLLKSLELKRAALAKQVSSAASVIRVLGDNAASARARSTGAGTNDVAAVLAPLEAELRAAEVRVQQLEHERARFHLVAPMDGVVERLPLEVGDLAGGELPVATIVAPDTGRVVACVPEARAASVDVGVDAELVTVFDRKRGRGVVESVTSEIAPLPERCQIPGSKAILLGRVAVVALDQPLATLAGQTELVTFHARRRPVPTRTTGRTSAPPTRSAPDAGAPVDMTVPAALRARSRFEPSGLVWLAAWDRYVIVSDDTGLEERDDHAPWVFTMTADGRVDPDPVVVHGIDKLDDVEAIAADGDALWLLSSQSYSRKGKRSAARQQLVRVEVRGKELTAVAHVELARLLDRAPDRVRAALGIPETRHLDLEAIAARDGALYIGLKAPVDGDARAQIWKVAAPAKLLAGDLAGARLSRWATAQLRVDADGRDVPGGIADMLFLDDDTLLLGATASGGDPQVQTGALYLARGAGELKLERIRTFPGLKPEGLATSPTAGQVTVAFDLGAQTPKWIRLAPVARGTP